MSTTPEQEPVALDPVTHDPIEQPEPREPEGRPDDPATPTFDEGAGDFTPAPVEAPPGPEAAPEATNMGNHPVDPGPAAVPTGDVTPPLVGESLPDGTAYVTPDGVIGVVGVEHDYQRPLRGSYFEAIMAFSHEVRKESTYH
jgi:hypothetical protein